MLATNANLTTKLYKSSKYKDIALISLFGVAAALSYINFQIYRPKIINQFTAVKGAQTSSLPFNLPYMQGTSELGSNVGKQGRQVTLEVKRAPKEIYNFYKSVLTEEGWVLKASTETDKSLVSDYKNEKATIKITISKEENPEISIVGINYASN